jgi:hypothetical protein
LAIFRREKGALEGPLFYQKATLSIQRVRLARLVLAARLVAAGFVAAAFVAAAFFGAFLAAGFVRGAFVLFALATAGGATTDQGHFVESQNTHVNLLGDQKSNVTILRIKSKKR